MDGDVRLYVLRCERVVSRKAGFELLARTQELVVVRARVPGRMFLGPAECVSGNLSNVNLG